VKDWYGKKKAAIEKVEPDYIKILDLKPTAPPMWVIAAGSKSGLMWGKFVDEFRAAPIPVEWKKDAELRGTYYDALDAASEPFKAGNAKPALKKCLDLSVQYQYFDSYSRDCEVWLAKNYKAEYHVVDELRPSPTLSNGGLDDKPPPLLVGGQAWHPAVVVAAGEKQEKAGNDNAAQGLATGGFGWDGGISHGQSLEAVITQRPDGVAVTFRVVENPVVTSVHFLGNKAVSADTLTALMDTAPGQVFNLKTYQEDVLKINSYYDKIGYGGQVPSHVTDVNIDLAAAAGSGTGDGQADTVIVNGTSGP